jgi:hypothetical protein
MMLTRAEIDDIVGVLERIKRHRVVVTLERTSRQQVRHCGDIVDQTRSTTAWAPSTA